MEKSLFMTEVKRKRKEGGTKGGIGERGEYFYCK